ncbi:MAG: hypothetical protein ACFHHU_05050 [Porticoccaceae bacterium]
MVNRTGSDSSSLDNMLELLVAGRNGPAPCHPHDGSACLAKLSITWTRICAHFLSTTRCTWSPGMALQAW